MDPQDHNPFEEQEINNPFHDDDLYGDNLGDDDDIPEISYDDPSSPPQPQAPTLQVGFLFTSNF